MCSNLCLSQSYITISENGSSIVKVDTNTKSDTLIYFVRDRVSCPDGAVLENIIDPFEAYDFQLNSDTLRLTSPLSIGEYRFLCGCSVFGACSLPYYNLSIVAAPIPSIPTLGQWSILLLFVIMIIFGVAVIKTINITSSTPFRNS